MVFMLFISVFAANRQRKILDGISANNQMARES